MFNLFARLVAAVMGGFIDLIWPGTTASVAHSIWDSIPHNVLGASVQAVAIFGLFIDLPLFFTCLALVMSFRLLWLAYRIYMTIKQAIPVVG